MLLIVYFFALLSVIVSSNSVWLGENLGIQKMLGVANEHTEPAIFLQDCGESTDLFRVASISHRPKTPQL